MTVVAGTVALNIIYEGLWLKILSLVMKKYLLLKTYPLQDKSAKPYPIYDKNGQNRYMTKTAENPYPLGPHIPI